MGKEVVLFKSEEETTLDEVIDFLRELADKLAERAIVLRKGDESVTLTIPNRLVLEVKAEEEDKRRGKEQSLEIELEWYEGEDEGQLSLG